MIALYKDPKGEKIFSKYGTQPNFKSQQGTVTESNTGTTDSALRRRILELENIIATNQVAMPPHSLIFRPGYFPVIVLIGHHLELHYRRMKQISSLLLTVHVYVTVMAKRSCYHCLEH